MTTKRMKATTGATGHVPPIAAAIGATGTTSSDATDDTVPTTSVVATATTALGVGALEVRKGLGLDPRLQKAISLRRGGETTPATASSTPGEVPVIALVKDVAAWESLSEVRSPAHIGDDLESVVTGRIPLDRIEVVRQLPYVKSLKAARPLKASLAAGVLEARADPATLAGLGRGGAGAVVGIVDYGCDFQHKNFRLANGSTRIEAIWHQGAGVATAGPFGYGRLYEQAEIDAALRQQAPYSALGYGPARDSGSSQGTHGTHVMDIAAGNGTGTGVPGFAPQVAIVFVDVSSDDIVWSGPEVIGVSFGDSVRLLEAVRFIFDRAGDRPCVVNISLGTNGGPHDGTTLVERGLDALARAKPNRAIVIAASNSYADGIHASGRLAVGETIDLDWTRPPSSGWQDELEIWYAGQDVYAVELLMPDGTSLGVVESGEDGEARDAAGRISVLVSSRRNDPNNGDNMIGIYVRDGLPHGRWRVRLTARQATTGTFHAWIERDDNSQSSFLTHRDDDYTVGSIACGKEIVVVASYDAHKPTTPLSYFSSAGPTRDGRNKPDLAGPGHAVVAAHSRTLNRATIKSGTSMAAPAVAGSLALILAEAAERSIALTAEQSRALLPQTARPPAGLSGWDRRWGAGRLDVAAALGALTPNAPVVARLPQEAALTMSTSKKGRKRQKR